jgi:hypothetical protein
MRLSRRQQLLQLGRTGLGRLVALLLRLEAMTASLRRRCNVLQQQVWALQRQVQELKAPPKTQVAKDPQRAAARRPGGPFGPHPPAGRPARPRAGS